MRMKKFAAIVLCCAPALALTGCSKPSVSEVQTAVEKTVKAKGATDEQAKKYAECAAPKMVDKVSRAGLNNIVKDGANAKGTNKDLSEVKKIDAQCGKEVLGG